MRTTLLVGLRAIWIVAAASLLIAAGTSWTVFRDLDDGLERSAALHGGPKSADGSLNILVMGLSTRLDRTGEPLPDDVLEQLRAGESDRGGYNANTLMLVHVAPGAARAVSLSIPRDSTAGFPGGAESGKIKEAYGRAKAAEERRLIDSGVQNRRELEFRSREAGRRAQAEVVHAVTGQPIDHLVEISLVGFFHIAQALDGVDVCLNRPARDPYSGADFPAGRQTLRGADALSFVRQRHGLANQDLDRTRRQQAFVTGVMARLKARGAFSDPSVLNGLFTVAKQDLVLDEGWDILGFANQAPALSGGKIAFHTLPLTDYTDAKARRTMQAQISGLLHPAVELKANTVDGVPCVD
ncbi:LytR family transcriptional regulator [Pseudonocardiaceae bacterium YIM PH 21723]|nr:LytR family transcriptional regulator [Pseudonocardiaceae bacterium YIM PH 21723]